jgi:hypothetical protein
MCWKDSVYLRPGEAVKGNDADESRIPGWSEGPRMEKSANRSSEYGILNTE